MHLFVTFEAVLRIKKQKKHIFDIDQPWFKQFNLEKTNFWQINNKD